MEDLNQNFETEESLFDDTEIEEDNLFDDDESDESPAEETEESEGKPAEEETVETAEEEPFMVIRYNKEDRPLNRDQTKALAQKGMNYDAMQQAMQERYDALNRDILRLAQMNNMDVPQYLKSLEDMQVNYAVSRELQVLKEQYPETDETILKELANNRVADILSKNQSQQAQNRQIEADKQRNEIRRQLDLFERKYPDVDARNLDQKVYDLMKEGYTLLEAYNEFKEEQAQADRTSQDQQKQIEKLNRKNQKKKLGNLNNTDSIMEDDFMAGFLSE